MFVCACAGCFGVAVASSQPVGRVVRIPGTGVEVVPPPDFGPSAHGNGLQHDSLLATIQVVEFPVAAWPSVATETSRARLAARGMTTLDSAWQTVQGRPALRYTVRQRQAGITYEKDMLLTADSLNTYMAVATWEAGTPAKVVEAMRASLLTLRRTESRSDDPFDGVPFRADLPARLSRTTRLGPAVVLSAPAEALRDSSVAVVMVVSNPALALAGDKEAWMRRATTAIRTLRDVTDIAFRTLDHAEGEAYEIEAAALNASTGAPVRVLNVAMPYGLSTFMMTAVAPADRATDLLPVFRALAASVRFTVSPR